MSLVSAFGALIGRAPRSEASATVASSPSPGAIAFADAVATVPREPQGATGSEKESGDGSGAALVDVPLGDGTADSGPVADAPSAGALPMLDAPPFGEALVFNAALPAAPVSPDGSSASAEVPLAESTSGATSSNSTVSTVPSDGTIPSSGTVSSDNTASTQQAALATSAVVPAPSGPSTPSTGSAPSKVSAPAASSPIAGAALPSAGSRATATAAMEGASAHASVAHAPVAHTPDGQLIEAHPRAILTPADATATTPSSSAGPLRADAASMPADSSSEGMTPVGGASPVAPTTAVAAAPAAAVATARQTLMPQIAAPVLSLAQAADGDHRLTLTVSPENLGPVTVRAHIVGGSIRIELHAPNDLGRDALRAILVDLRRDLAVAAPNATVAVSTHDGLSSSTGQQYSGQQSSGGQQNAGGPGQNNATGQQSNGSPHADRGQDRNGAAARTISPGAQPDTVPTTFTTPHGGIDVYA